MVAEVRYEMSRFIMLDLPKCIKSIAGAGSGWPTVLQGDGGEYVKMKHRRFDGGREESRAEKRGGVGEK
jgi:hypothetical protein